MLFQFCFSSFSFTFSFYFKGFSVLVLFYRPPDIVVDGLIFYRDSFSFFFCQLPSKLTERNSVKIGHMLRIKCNLKMHVQNLGYALPYKLGAQNHLFSRFCNLTATLTAYIFPTKHDIYKSAVHCKLQGSPYIVLKRHQLWSTSSFKLEVRFHPPSVNSAFHFIARLHRWRSANDTQPNFAKWWTVNRAKNLP